MNEHIPSMHPKPQIKDVHPSPHPFQPGWQAWGWVWKMDDLSGYEAPEGSALSQTPNP